MTEQVDLSPAGLAKAKKIAEEAWDWPPSNRDAACDLAHTLLPVLIDRVQSFTWDDIDTLAKYLGYYGCLAETQHVIAKIAALLSPRE